ncbi:MAG: hypothetical protein V9H69_22725 [Anaerolineae bacterium]
MRPLLPGWAAPQLPQYLAPGRTGAPQPKQMEFMVDCLEFLKV